MSAQPILESENGVCERSPDMSGNFFDRITKINPPASPEPARHTPEAKPMADGRERWRAGKIFLFSLYPFDKLGA